MSDQKTFWKAFRRCQKLHCYGNSTDLIDIYCEILFQDDVSTWTIGDLFERLEIVMNVKSSKGELKKNHTPEIISTELEKLKEFVTNGIPYRDKEWFWMVFYFMRFMGWVLYGIWYILCSIITTIPACLYYDCYKETSPSDKYKETSKKLRNLFYTSPRKMEVIGGFFFLFIIIILGCWADGVFSPQTTSTQVTPTVDLCEKYVCGLECIGPCGWNSELMKCVQGAVTSTFERHFGNCDHLSSLTEGGG
jgi:hypothetical protein